MAQAPGELIGKARMDAYTNPVACPRHSSVELRVGIRDVVRRIYTNPGAAIAMAGALGLVLGFLLKKSLPARAGLRN